MLPHLSLVVLVGLDQRIYWRSRDAAHVLMVSGHANIAAFSPRLAPRVLDDPVVLWRSSRIVRAKTNS